MKNKVEVVQQLREQLVNSTATLSNGAVLAGVRMVEVVRSDLIKHLEDVCDTCNVAIDYIVGEERANAKPRMSALFDKDGVILDCRELRHPEGHDVFTVADVVRANQRYPHRAPIHAELLYNVPQHFDRARETSRRQSAVELLLSMGFVWNNGKWEFRK